MRQWSVFLLLLALFQCLIPTALQAKESLRTLTVMPPAARGGDTERWLSQAIADMLGQKFAEIPGYIVLERERLQDYLKESELDKAGFLQETDVRRLGGIAKLDLAIHGSYMLDDDEISIHLFAVDMQKGVPVRQAEAEGEVDTLHALLNTLAEEIAGQTDMALDAATLERLRFTPTHSLPAIEYFYRGLDAYDRGEYEDAYAQFEKSAGKDSRFLEATFWSAKMLEAMRQVPLAVAAYNALRTQSPNTVEGLDAHFFYARLLEETDPKAAIAAYRQLIEQHRDTPHQLEAATRLSNLYASMGKAKSAFRTLQILVDARDRFEHRKEQHLQQEVQDMVQKTMQSPTFWQKVQKFFLGAERSETAIKRTDWEQIYITAKGIRHSRFFSWDKAYALYGEAIQRMAALTPLVMQATDAAGESVEIPRGVVYVTPEQPEVHETSLGKRLSLFHEERLGPNWRELFYVVTVPEGYEATGIDLELTGKMNIPSPHHSFVLRVLPFPMPENYLNNWLGTIYGQNPSTTTLRKTVGFYGKNRTSFMLQLVENHSTIDRWKIKVHLQEKNGTAPARQAVIENNTILADIPLPRSAGDYVAIPQFAFMQQPKKTMAIADNHQDGMMLVHTRNLLGNQQTDLAAMASPDGRQWSEQAMEQINSLSNDYFPTLVRGEDGDIRLFWISDRRGRGWELWTSAYRKDGWEFPVRIPLETFAGKSVGDATKPVKQLLEYAVMQDRQGRWVLVWYSPAIHAGSILASYDLKHWEMVQELTLGSSIKSLTIHEDRAGRFQLATVNAKDRLTVSTFISNGKWSINRYRLNLYPFPGMAGYHPLHLFEASGNPVVIFSDSIYGLQHGAFSGDGKQLTIDLIKGAGLESYAITQRANGEYLIAEHVGDTIRVRQASNLSSPLNDINPSASMVYKERTKNSVGHLWQRIFARIRYIMPDVSAVGLQEDGRVWWGIETGIMSLLDEDFYFSDVSQGFFYHHIRDVVPCGNGAYFFSNTLGKAQFGRAVPVPLLKYHLKTFAVDNAEGGVSAMICLNNNTIIAGLQDGQLVAVKGMDTDWRVQLPTGGITALVADSSTNVLWAATGKQLYRVVDRKPEAVALPDGLAGHVTDMAVDTRGMLWIAAKNDGIYQRQKKGWRHYSADNGLPYADIGRIKADPVSGVWFIADESQVSQGVGYINAGKPTLFNPPDHVLEAPTDLEVENDGTVWIGTAFKGLYSLKRAQ